MHQNFIFPPFSPVNYHLKSSGDTETTKHTFTSSHLVYCNGLLIGIDHRTIHRLRTVENLAVRLQTKHYNFYF